MYRWIFVGGVVLGITAPIGADSIWQRRDPTYAYLFQDNRARSVGDVINIAIATSTIVDDIDSRTNTKTTNTTASVGFGLAATTPLVNATSNRNFTGSGAMATNQSFIDNIGALVVDILPNGNLVVEGYRTVVVQGEERVLRMTGIVRPADIAYPNTVSSNAVANYRISYLGRGPQTRTASQNYLGRVVNRLWPF